MSNIKTIFLDKVSRHNKKDDLWIIVHHNGENSHPIGTPTKCLVYDVTKYLDHPGGADVLIEMAGKDSTVAFENVGHSSDAREIMKSLLIGKVEGASEHDSSSSKLPMPRSNIKVENNDLDTKSPTLARRALKISLTGSALFLAYEAVARSPVIDWIAHHHGGFWKGALLSAVATLLVVAAAGLYFEKIMNAQSKKPYLFPAHFKPIVHITKPITKVEGYLKPEEYQKLPLIQKEKLSSNTFKFIFKLPTDKTILGLPIGQHVSIRAEIDGKAVSRSYTPISNNSDLGVLRLVIKCYPDGELTGKYLQNLNVGDLVEIRGPKGTMRYRKGIAKEIGMVAGGTGITPMYQLIRAICEDPTDDTHISLLYGNRSEADILLRSELEEFQRCCPQNFKLQHVLSQASESWNGARGFVSKDMLEQKFPMPGKESKALLCGPPALVNSMKKNLIELGWDKPRAVSKSTDQVFCF